MHDYYDNNLTIFSILKLGLLLDWRGFIQWLSEHNESLENCQLLLHFHLAVHCGLRSQTEVQLTTQPEIINGNAKNFLVINSNDHLGCCNHITLEENQALETKRQETWRGDEPMLWSRGQGSHSHLNNESFRLSIDMSMSNITCPGVVKARTCLRQWPCRYEVRRWRRGSPCGRS